MRPQHLTYLKEKGTVWFNPCYGIIGFWNEYRKLTVKLNKPHKYIWSHRDLKRAKEIYAISIIAMAMNTSKKKEENWMIQKPKSDPPDGVIGTIVLKNRHREMHVREVEVVEHIDGNILDTIRKKLAGKQYEPNTILVCCVSGGGFYDMKKISQIISKEATSLGHIFLVFPGVKLTDIPENVSDDKFLNAIYRYSSVQIKPVYNFVSIDPKEDCEAWKRGDNPNYFIFESGTKRGHSITLENPPKLF